MKNNRVILCLGSNTDTIKSIAHATKLLHAFFSCISFSDAVYTQPVGCSNPAPFLNRVAIVHTSRPYTEVAAALKQMERTIGRCTNDSQQGHILIDIDLLQWNEQEIKPEDLNKEYVQTGLKTLISSLHASNSTIHHTIRES